MIPVRQMLVNPKKHSIKCPFPMEAEYITVHNTYNDASANNEVTYMIGNSNQVSYHFAVDDKEVVQGIPIDRNAWHCGDGNGTGNRKSIGVEICYSKSGGTKYYQAEGLASQFITHLLKERGWGIERVKKHQDWSGKNCPHRILDEGRWEDFLNAIQKELDTKVVIAAMKEPEAKVIFNDSKPIPAMIKDGRTYVHVREIADLLGLKIIFDNESKTTKLYK